MVKGGDTASKAKSKAVVSDDPVKKAREQKLAVTGRVSDKAVSMGMFSRKGTEGSETGEPIPRTLQQLNGASIVRASHARKARRVFSLPAHLIKAPASGMEVVDANTNSPSILMKFAGRSGALKFSGATVKLATPLIGLRAVGSGRTERSMDIFAFQREVVVLSETQWVNDDGSDCADGIPEGIFTEAASGSFGGFSAATATTPSAPSRAALSQEVQDEPNAADANDAEESASESEVEEVIPLSDRPKRATRTAPTRYQDGEDDEDDEEEDSENEDDDAEEEGSANEDEDGEDAGSDNAQDESAEEDAQEDSEEELISTPKRRGSTKKINSEPPSSDVEVLSPPSRSVSPAKRKRRAADDSDDDYVVASPGKRTPTSRKTVTITLD